MIIGVVMIFFVNKELFVVYWHIILTCVYHIYIVYGLERQTKSINDDDNHERRRKTRRVTIFTMFYIRLKVWR